MLCVRLRNRISMDNSKSVEKNKEIMVTDMPSILLRKKHRKLKLSDLPNVFLDQNLSNP